MGPRFARQLLLIGLASSLWSVAGVATSLAWLGAYASAWLACQLPPIRGRVRAATPLTLLLLSAALIAPGLAFGYRARSELVQNEGLLGAATRLQDRMRLHALPSIAPPLLSIDRPQTFFIATPGARQLSWRSAGVKALPGQALGAGLFRVDYDPRRDGIPTERSERLPVELHYDGEVSERSIALVRPLAHPRWFCVSPDRARAVALSEETDELFVLAAAGVVQRAPTRDGPVDCAFLDAEHVAISHRFEPTLAVFDIAGTQPPRTVQLPACQGRVARSPSGRLLAVALTGTPPEIALVHLPEIGLAARVPLEYGADWLAFGPDDDTLFATTRGDAALHRFRRAGAGFTPDGTLALGRPIVTLTRSADGARLWAAATDLRAAGHAQLGNHFIQDQILTIDAATLSVAARRITAARSERQSKPGDVDRGASPMSIQEARDGALWITFAGTDELWRLERDAGLPLQLDLGERGLYAPHGVAELADGSVFVSSPISGAFGVFPPGATVPRVIAVSPNDTALLEHDRAALARRVGERGFYEATRSGIACQSCHLHADSDGAAYNLGDHRLLPTLSVRGLADTAPYLRDGSYPRLRDLDDVAQTLYRGYLRNQAARGETLEAFIRGLPRTESATLPEQRNAAIERRGYAAFRKAHCDACHAPPAFTNLAQVPLRFLFPDQAAKLGSEEVLDTPSLLSVSASAPYLNDGRAATLEAVLVTQNTRNLHGDVRSLSLDERRDLIAFLGSL